MKEVRTFNPPEEPGGAWSMLAETDLRTTETKFTIGQEFTMDYGRNMDDGIMYVTVTKPEPHILKFNSEEKLKGWTFEANFTFSPLGIKSDQYFITKDVLMTKYYERMNKDQWEAEKKLEKAENPFGESGDDAFGHDDDFGDFMEDDDNGRSLNENSYEDLRYKEEEITTESTREWELVQSNVDITDEDEDKYYSGDDQEYEEEEEDWTDW